MQSSPPLPRVDTMSRPPVFIGTREWVVGRANWPSAFIRTLRGTRNIWPGLKIHVEDLGGFLAKTVTLRVEGPKDGVDEYLFAVDRWVRSVAPGC